MILNYNSWLNESVNDNIKHLVIEEFIKKLRTDKEQYLRYGQFEDWFSISDEEYNKHDSVKKILNFERIERIERAKLEKDRDRSDIFFFEFKATKFKNDMGTTSMYKLCWIDIKDMKLITDNIENFPELRDFAVSCYRSVLKDYYPSEFLGQKYDI